MFDITKEKLLCCLVPWIYARILKLIPSLFGNGSGSVVVLVEQNLVCFSRYA